MRLHYSLGVPRCDLRGFTASLQCFVHSVADLQLTYSCERRIELTLCPLFVFPLSLYCDCSYVLMHRVRFYLHFSPLLCLSRDDMFSCCGCCSLWLQHVARTKESRTHYRRNTLKFRKHRHLATDAMSIDSDCVCVDVYVCMCVCALSVSLGDER